MKNRELKLPLPSADDLFTTQAEREQTEKVVNLSLSDIDDYPNHPFKVRMDAKMQETVESVAQHGVLVPALVRQKSDTSGARYEMIAGHRRKESSRLAERDVMPCIVRNLTDEEATIIMVDSNLQREQILPSEKAFAYKMKLDAMKRQAGRPSKENSSPVGTHLRSDEELANISGDSRNQIHRYIRLTELTPPLLNLVDDGRLKMRSAVELSYVPHEQQEILRDVIEAEDCTPSHAQTVKMRKLSDEGQLTSDAAASIMQDDTPTKAEQFKMPRERIQRFFPADTPVQTMQETIIKALELWQKNQ